MTLHARRAPVRRRLHALCVLLLGACSASLAGTLQFCDPPAKLSADQQDRLFRFAGIVKAALEASGQSLALVARSGLDLGRFGVRYSHAGLSIKGSTNAPWSVRQLYYACDERQPRVYDQGLAGFLLGLNDPTAGYVSVVYLPRAEAAALERVALDNGQALQLLGAAYSANAYAFGLQYQNCNQWVVETMATAWGRLEAGDNLRAAAQVWLQDRGYQPTRFDAGVTLTWLAAFVPWLHHDDHPRGDLERGVFRVSMPASIEAFVQARVPGASRMEFCLAERRVVVRHGWEPIADGCVPEERDRVITLE